MQEEQRKYFEQKDKEFSELKEDLDSLLQVSLQNTNLVGTLKLPNLEY